MIVRLIKQIKLVHATLLRHDIGRWPRLALILRHPHTNWLTHNIRCPQASLARTVSTGALRRLGSLMVLRSPRVIRLARGGGSLFCSGSYETGSLLLTAPSNVRWLAPLSPAHSELLAPAAIFGRPICRLARSTFCGVLRYSRLGKRLHPPGRFLSQYTTPPHRFSFRMIGTLFLAGSLQPHRFHLA
jgi:hypothetical protein